MWLISFCVCLRVMESSSLINLQSSEGVQLQDLLVRVHGGLQLLAAAPADRCHCCLLPLHWLLRLLCFCFSLYHDCGSGSCAENMIVLLIIKAGSWKSCLCWDIFSCMIFTEVNSTGQRKLWVTSSLAHRKILKSLNLNLLFTKLNPNECGSSHTYYWTKQPKMCQHYYYF